MAIWLFDSDCVLCTRGVQYTLKHEKEPTIRFVAITSDEGRALALQHGLDPDDPTSFLFIDDGQVYDASDAVLALSRHLKGPARALPLLRLLPTALRDAGYRVFARNRYRLFGKVESCITPTPQQRHRFVL